MTELLEHAIARLKTLPAEEQDAIAARLLAEIEEIGRDSTAQQEEARQRFRSHAGAIALGYGTGMGNESIDADLARAYAGEYEE